MPVRDEELPCLFHQFTVVSGRLKGYRAGGLCRDAHSGAEEAEGHGVSKDHYKINP